MIYSFSESNKCLAPKVDYSHLYLRFGFLGNHPFFTRFSWSKISLIVQNDEKAKTPNSEASRILSTQTEAMIPAIPNKRNIHQQPVPQWYSALITMGWNRPIIKKVQMPIRSPERWYSFKKSIQPYSGRIGISFLMLWSNEISVSVEVTPGISCILLFSKSIKCSLSRAYTLVSMV